MEFRDLKRQYECLKKEIDQNIAEVISDTHFISGKHVRNLEEKLADYVGVRHCISCANGTDAISIALLAWGIGEGDAVFVPDFTFFSSGECPATVGATPVFVDVKKDTYNLDPKALERAIEGVIREGKYKPKVVVAVDLFGLPANYDEIVCVCNKHNLLLLEDGAQGFGGEVNGRKACSFGDISTTSFFPAKPLGAYGDGGAIFTNNDEWAALIRSICVHGKAGDDKYNNIRLGVNSRLDTLQAAILIPKFCAFVNYELNDINAIASLYTDLLEDADLEVELPKVEKGYLSSWAQYTIQLPQGIDRVALQRSMKADGIPTMVYYARPMHKQGAFVGTDSSVASCPITEELCKKVLCLPIHPYLKKEECKVVIEALKKALK